MKQNETSKTCRDYYSDRAIACRDTSRVAMQPEDGIAALAECMCILYNLQFSFLHDFLLFVLF